MGTPVVDALAFIGESLFGRPQDPEDLILRLSRASIDHVVLAPQRPVAYELAPGNAEVAAFVALDPHSRRQLGRVDPNRPGAVGEVRRCVEEWDVDGFYLNPREEVFPINGAAADRVIAAVADAGVPLVIETGTPWVSEALQVAEVAARYPSLPIIMTNGGQLNISGLGQGEALMALETCSNILIQTSGVYRQDFIEAVVSEFGSDRVMFASSAPIYDPAYEVLRVRGAAILPHQRDAVLGTTAHSLFWKKPRT